MPSVRRRAEVNVERWDLAYLTAYSLSSLMLAASRACDMIEIEKCAMQKFCDYCRVKRRGRKMCSDAGVVAALCRLAVNAH